jgi:tetratricopeptide (TPR) repeat protein
MRIVAVADAVCRNETFRSSPRLRDFLRYLVNRQMREGTAKETLIGVEFFDRVPGYDPRKDPIVRVEAHRLRRRLEEYYRQEGAHDRSRIELPPGGYTVVLRERDEPDAVAHWRLMVCVEGPDPLTSEGLTVELIRQLGTLRGITVLAPASSLAARNPDDAVRQLGANAILDCRLDGVSLHATLSLAHRDTLVPTATFDDVIQPSTDALAQFVAAHIGTRRARVAPSRASLDLESYQTYLAGRAWFHRWSPDNLVHAASCFERVLARHPGFAPAYAGLADIQILRAYWCENQARPVLQRGLGYARTALELDPSCTDALCALGALEAVLHHQWDVAEASFRVAFDTNANSAIALNWLAIIVLTPQLRFADAIDTAFAAYDLDPASPEIGNEIVWVRICCGQYAEAAEQARRIVELHPGFLEAYWSLASAEAACGEHAAAIDSLDHADRLYPGIPMTLALRCFVEGARGNLDNARSSLARLDASVSDPQAGRAIFWAWAYGAVGDIDRGMLYLERAVDAADPHALYVEVFPPNAPLRAHSRYAGILHRQNLPRLSTAALDSIPSA